VIRFGWSTLTYDADGEPTTPQTEPVLERERLEELFDAFRGLILQTPPPVSAKKVAGRPAYELARKHIAVELQPVEVIVRSLELLWVEGCEAGVRVECSAGTYVRSIAHDAGRALGCGAHLKSLRRLQSGQFAISQARTLEQLAELAAEERLGEALIPAMQLLPEFPSEIVDQLSASQIRQGRDFRVSPFKLRDGVKRVKAVSRSGELIAIGEAVLPNVYHPILVL
jgi:tRNA pseudouridine55 synthase